MITAICDVRYNAYTEPQGEAIRPVQGRIYLEIYENGYLVGALSSNCVYSDPPTVSNFQCTNSNFTASDLISLMSSYNMYSVSVGIDDRFTVSLISSVLDKPVSSPRINTRCLNIYTLSGFSNTSCTYFVGLDTGLYNEFIDNSNVFHLLSAIYQTNPATYLDDDDYKSCKAIEVYNTNVLLSRINDSLTTLNNSNNGSSDVDLSTINTQLTNIANNLKTTVVDDETGENIEVSVTEIIKDKEDTVNVLNQIQEVETKNKERELVPFLNNDEWSF